MRTRDHYPGPVKQFVVYTLARLGLFVASAAILIGVFQLLGYSNLLLPLVLAAVVSGIASYFILNRQREAFARRVEERASRAASAFEERKAREDQD